MHSAGYHQANIMAASIDDFRNEIIESVRQVQDNVITAVHTPPSQFEDMQPSPQNETANAVISNSEISGLVTMTNSLATTVQSIQQNMNHNGTGRGGRAGRGGRGCQGGRRPNRQNGNQFGQNPRWHRTITTNY